MSAIRCSTVPVETVNFHVWQPCNMRCSFCFARFRDVRSGVLPEGHLTQGQALTVVALLAEAGFQKITFAGGEPFLCPWLLDLIARAKNDGMTTSVVTNGSLLTSDVLSRLPGLLDWLVMSIDSADPGTLRRTGRVTASRPLSAFEYVALCRGATRNNIRLKINTVVTQENWHEDLTTFILAARPLAGRSCRCCRCPVRIRIAWVPC